MSRLSRVLSLTAALALMGALATSEAQASAMLKPTGGVSLALTPRDLSIDTRIKGAFAQTTITTAYANPNPQRVEADFVYTAPEGAVVTGFAYWYRGEKVVARVVEKARAARIYQYITSRMRDPALIEMIGKNTFRARIFPVEANTDLKIELKLAQVLKPGRDGYVWSHPLKDETSRGPLDQFQLTIQTDGTAKSALGTFQKGRLTVHRSNFLARQNVSVTMVKPALPLRSSLFAAREGGTDGFFSLVLTPSANVTRPHVSIQGVKTYDVVVPSPSRLKAGQNLLVVGRYRGGGRANVSLNGLTSRVTFGNSVQANNVAAQLWATHFIEKLSAKSSNRARVLQLSTRFGVPSRWTSWLAIPEEERQTFLRQTLAADRTAAAKAYAQAIARGDAKGAKQQKAVADTLAAKLREQGSNYAENEELQPLENYLNDELKAIQRAQVQAKYGGVPVSQASKWKLWIANLKKAGATEDGDGVEMPVYVLEDELRLASKAYLEETEQGRANGKRGRQLQQRLKQLAATKVAQDYGWNENTFMQEQAAVRVNALALELEFQRAAARRNPAKERELSRRLARVVGPAGTSTESAVSDARRIVWRGKMDSVAKLLSSEMAAGRVDSAAAKRYDAQLKQLGRKAGIPVSDVMSDAAYQLVKGTSEELATEIRAKRENSARATQLSQKLAAMEKRSGLQARHIVDNAWAARASGAAHDYMSIVRTKGKDSSEAKAAHKEVARAAQHSSVSTDDFVSVAARKHKEELSQALAPEIVNGTEDSQKATALRRKLDEIKSIAPGSPEIRSQGERLEMAWAARAHDAAYKLAQAKKRGDEKQATALRQELTRFAKNTRTSVEDYEQYERDRLANGGPSVDIKEYSARPGDPLIAVQAPRDSAQVIAILPSGEIKRLVWNTVSQRWEARFDVPGYAAEGTYTISILVVDAKGSRTAMKMFFHVDTTAPDGTGEVQREGKFWQLSFEAQQGLDHVDAFLPWNERVELKRTGDIFAARVTVPEAWHGRASQVRYVLTDAAHNRTEVLVDMSQ